MTSANPKLVVYADATGEWRWRLVAINGKTVADSGEGYGSKRKAVNAAIRLSEILSVAEVAIEDAG